MNLRSQGTVPKEGERHIKDCRVICTPSEVPYIVSTIPWVLEDLVVGLRMEGGPIIHIAALHSTNETRVGAHIHVDVVGLLLTATI